MEKTMKVLVAIAILALAVYGVAVYIPGMTRDSSVRDAQVQEALRTRQPRAGEQGAEMRAAMEDIQRAIPQPTPEEQAKVNALTQAAPGGASLMDLMLSAESVKTWPQPQKDAALQTALQQMANPDPEIRLMAVEVLGRMGDSRAIPQVFNMQKDPDPHVQAAATRTLKALGYPIP